MTSDSVIAWVPTTTATRSMTFCAAAANPIREASRKSLISKCLPYGKRELKMADALQSLNRRIIEKIPIGSLQAIKCRGIEAVSDVQPDGSHGRAIADAEADGLDHVVEVGDVALFVTEGDASQVRV